MNDVTRILSAIKNGDPAAPENLLPLVYEELRKLAYARLAREKPGQTLQATALVHEAYLRLVGPDPNLHWDGKGHFFAAAAEAMRRIVVENARRKKSIKHGGDYRRAEIDIAELPDTADDKMLALDEALTKLALTDPSKAELVKLRYFAGLTIKEAAQLLGISTATADRNWAYARAWLQQEISAHTE